MNKETYSVKEAAEILGISYNSMNNLTWVEGFPVIQIGRKKVIPKDAFYEWLKNQKRSYPED